MNHDGSSEASMHFNLARAEKHYFKRQQVLGNTCLPVVKRLRAWHDATGAAASYNAETWHLTAGMLSEIRTWELQMLRRLLRLRRRPGESFMSYNIRTALMITRWMQLGKIPFLYDRVLKSVCKAAWGDSVFSLGGGLQSQLGAARSFRNEVWGCTVVFITPQYKRRKLGLTHDSAGKQRATWERPFVEAWGMH